MPWLWPCIEPCWRQPRSQKHNPRLMKCNFPERMLQTLMETRTNTAPTRQQDLRFASSSSILQKTPRWQECLSGNDFVVRNYNNVSIEGCPDGPMPKFASPAYLWTDCWTARLTHYAGEFADYKSTLWIRTRLVADDRRSEKYRELTARPRNTPRLPLPDAANWHITPAPRPAWEIQR